MYGDYEAQRHWMEVTTHLPVSQWYFHDLQWWGLDYPPLTAYHSWIMGKIGALINPSWFALFSSRGSDDPNLKIFMRATVIVSEYLIYVPMCVVFVRRFGRFSGTENWTSSLALVAILMQPATILIDHVHFQYNTVMLGFTLASMSSLLADRYKWAAFFFVAALGFKQMALYYAPAAFCYLLGRCFFPFRPVRLIGIAIATVISFAILLLPMALGTLYDTYQGVDYHSDLDGPTPPLPLFPEIANYVKPQSAYYPFVAQLLQMVHRVFPFARGLFEDKVANFWCALNVVVKLRNFPAPRLSQAALAMTLLSILPPSLTLLVQPRKATVPLAFAATAWGFFLFAYQVHEKSILLPLMPMTLLLAGPQGMKKHTRAWVGFANLLGVWTMFPLLSRVDLRPPYAVLSLLWAYLLGLPPTSLSAYFDSEQAPLVQWGTFLVHMGFYAVMILWHLGQALIPPPLEKPDLWVVLNVGVGFVGFLLCYLWCLWTLLAETSSLPKRSDSLITRRPKSKSLTKR